MLSCLLQEQRMVFFSSDWARLTLVAESLLLYLQVRTGNIKSYKWELHSYSIESLILFAISRIIVKLHPVSFLSTHFISLLLRCPLFQPLSWQQPYVPVLAGGMLDFLMAPTAFLMGCHISHFEEVAAVSAPVSLSLFELLHIVFFF